MGPIKDSKTVYVVHIKDPKTGEYDEDKVMLGFDSKEEAGRAFWQHYDEPEKFLIDITEMPMDEFKKKIYGDFEKGKQTNLLKAANVGRYAIPAFTTALLTMMGGGYGHIFDKNDSNKGAIIGSAIGGGLGLGGGIYASRLLDRALAGKGIRESMHNFAKNIGSDIGEGFKEKTVTEPIKNVKDKIFRPFGLFKKGR